jgi:hypothetical protein
MPTMTRLAIVPALGAAGLILAAGASAAPRGAPSELRIARPADHVAHPDAWSEWWTLRAVHPRGRGTIELRILREANLAGVRLLGDVAGGPVDTGLGLTAIVAGKRRLVGLGPEKTGVVVEAARRGLVLNVAGATVAGRLRLRNARRGPAAFGWRLGTGVRDSGPAPVTLAWTVPVATSSISGTLLLGGTRPIELHSWRASYEHGWGGLLFRDPWETWDQYVVHGRRAGDAWLVHGLNRVDTVTGPGARDAQWLGVLARVDRRGVRFCRPRVHRRRWVTTADLQIYPARLRAACRGLRFAVQDRSGIFLDYIDHFEAHVPVTARAGARGMAVHLGH